MEEQFQGGSDRHPFRFLVKSAVFLGLIYVVGRFLADKKNEFADLTESEAKDKLVTKISPKLGDETANEIADQVIPKLKDRGLVRPDPMEAAAPNLDEAADDNNKAADKVSEAVDSVVKDEH